MSYGVYCSKWGPKRHCLKRLPPHNHSNPPKRISHTPPASAVSNLFTVVKLSRGHFFENARHQTTVLQLDSLCQVCPSGVIDLKRLFTAHYCSWSIDGSVLKVRNPLRLAVAYVKWSKRLNTQDPGPAQPCLIRVVLCAQPSTPGRSLCVCW